VSERTVVRATRWIDTKAGQLRSPAVIVVEGNRIVAVGDNADDSSASTIDLGDVTVLPGLMDMELNLLIGGPENPDGLPNPMHGVVDDPIYRSLRATVNARATLMAGFTTVRNLGLMVKTGGYLLDVSLSRAIENGWIIGPRIKAAGHAISPTGGHLDPTMVRNLAPHIMPLSVEEGIANGEAEVRKAVRYQIKYGANLIKISASGGVMSHNTVVGAQQYSDGELAAIVDEAHRAGLHVAAHAHGDEAIRGCIKAGVDCIEHGSLATEETLQLMVDRGTFLVPTSYLAEGMAVARAGDQEHQKKAAEVFPRAKETLRRAIKMGVKIACGSDAPGIPHGSQANELWAMVDRGMTPMQAIQAATVVSAELIRAEGELGTLEPGYLADIIAVPGDPSVDIEALRDVCFVMKDGRVHKSPIGEQGPD
jgi:imidazolonepropionase-like amidohydrolase